MTYRLFIIPLLVVIWIEEIAQKKEKNPTSYQYGGELNLIRTRAIPPFYPLDFRKAADFSRLTFDSTVILFSARFDNPVDFSWATFESTANFHQATFNTIADFRNTTFNSTADFRYTTFDSIANFTRTTFNSRADFYRATFNSTVNFHGSRLYTAYFRWAKFDGTTDFSLAGFNSNTYFDGAIFNSTVDFERARFDRRVDFRSSTFESSANFRWATFSGEAVFLDAEAKEYLNFEGAVIGDVILLGSHKEFKADLTLAIFRPEGSINLCGVANLKLPVHNLNRLSLLDTLSYTQKKNIIDQLKVKSFGNSKEAAFELDYLLAKSTKYQAISDSSESARWYDQIGDWIYDATMGFGYRPFRIIWWAIGIMLAGSLVFFATMRSRVNEYMAKTFKHDGKISSFDKFETYLNCAYFSVMLFFTFRLKGNLLTFFDEKEKKYILAEWLLGLAVYAAFLYHTSAVVQNIRSLFVDG